MQKIDIEEKLAQIDEHWQPHIVAELNGQHVKIAKLLGEFDWHRHEDEDELFFVVHGSIEIQLRDRTVALGEGEMFVVPKGVEHRPVVREEAHVVLFEPAGTINTGNVRSERTVDTPRRI